VIVAFKITRSKKVGFYLQFVEISVNSLQTQNQNTFDELKFNSTTATYVMHIAIPKYMSIITLIKKYS